MADDGGRLAEDQRAYLSGAGPEGDADSNLCRALAHRVREHTIDAERGKRKRDDREGPMSASANRSRLVPRIDDLRHRRRAVHDQLRIESLHLTPYRSQQFVR